MRKNKTAARHFGNHATSQSPPSPIPPQTAGSTPTEREISKQGKNNNLGAGIRHAPELINKLNSAMF
jgi:hypothetical protein